MMTEVSRTVQGVNPHEYEALKHMLETDEGFQVTSTGIDSFVAKQGNLMTLTGDYNRNGNILTIVGKFSSWLNPNLEHLKEQILRVVNKEDATDKVQHRPLKTSEAVPKKEEPTEPVESVPEGEPVPTPPPQTEPPTDVPPEPPPTEPTEPTPEQMGATPEHPVFVQQTDAGKVPEVKKTRSSK
jgi:hypothetical protein